MRLGMILIFFHSFGNLCSQIPDCKTMETTKILIAVKDYNCSISTYFLVDTDFFRTHNIRRINKKNVLTFFSSDTILFINPLQNYWDVNKDILKRHITNSTSSLIEFKKKCTKRKETKLFIVYDVVKVKGVLFKIDYKKIAYYDDYNHDFLNKRDVSVFMVDQIETIF